MTWVFASCLIVSFLLSGMEAGVFALSRLRIRQQMRVGRRSARLLHGFLEHPENFLWTILVGNTIANLFILGTLVVVLQQWVGSLWLFLPAFTIAVFLFYALFDLLPKMLFRAYPNRLCMMVVRPYRVVATALGPVVWLVEWISGLLLRWRGGRVRSRKLFGNREELRSLMQDSAQTFSSEERAMISRVLDLQSLTVRQSMTPFSKVVSVKAEAPLEQVLQLVRETRFTSLPVVETREGRDRVVGLVTVSAILYSSDWAPGLPVAAFIRPALFIEEDLRLEDALGRMQRSGQRLVIVLGRDRREVGIISLQDILKVVFGGVSA